MRILSYSLLAQQVLQASAFVSHKNEVLRLGGVTAASPTCLMDAPESLAEEGAWQAFLDEDTTGLIYYFDTKTGESLWEPPSSTFPSIRLSRKKQRLAEDLRRDYRKARQQEAEGQVQLAEEPKAEDQSSGLPSWIEGLVEVVDEQKVAPVREPAAEEPKEQQEGWFGGLLGKKGGIDAGEERNKEEEKAMPNGEAVSETMEGKVGGFFSALGELVETASSALEVPEVEVERKPAEEKKQASKQAVEKKAAPKKKEPTIVVDNRPKPIQIQMGSHVLPHPAKVRWGGEDALFTKGRTFGVFDGVSGAEKIDGVPLYSRTLAQEMKKYIGIEGVSIKGMTKLLTDAANYADSSATGASTAVVASIGENGFLQALNVGDSMCMVVRDSKIAAKTREISHFWECPYQLSDDSPDRPRDGTKLNVELISGDLVIMGSDGIFDNVNDDSLLELIGKTSTPNPNQLAKKICDLSRKQSLDQQGVTPYGQQAKRRGDPDYKDGLGGKVDDASCVVVVCK